MHQRIYKYFQLFTINTLALIFLVGVLSLGACTGKEGPFFVIDKVEPAEAPAGATVKLSISGAEFDYTTDSVFVGTAEAFVLGAPGAGAQEIEFEVPGLTPGQYPVTVQVDDRTATIEFRVLSGGVAGDIPEGEEGAVEPAAKPRTLDFSQTIFQCKEAIVYGAIFVPEEGTAAVEPKCELFWTLSDKLSLPNDKIVIVGLDEGDIEYSFESGKVNSGSVIIALDKTTTLTLQVFLEEQFKLEEEPKPYFEKSLVIPVLIVEDYFPFDVKLSRNLVQLTPQHDPPYEDSRKVTADIKVHEFYDSWCISLPKQGSNPQPKKVGVEDSKAVKIDVLEDLKAVRAVKTDVLKGFESLIEAVGKVELEEKCYDVHEKHLEFEVNESTTIIYYAKKDGFKYRENLQTINFEIVEPSFVAHKVTFHGGPGLVMFPVYKYILDLQNAMEWYIVTSADNLLRIDNPNLLKKVEAKPVVQKSGSADENEESKIDFGKAEFMRIQSSGTEISEKVDDLTMAVVQDKQALCRIGGAKGAEHEKVSDTPICEEICNDDDSFADANEKICKDDDFVKAIKSKVSPLSDVEENVAGLKVFRFNTINLKKTYYIVPKASPDYARVYKPTFIVIGMHKDKDLKEKMKFSEPIKDVGVDAPVFENMILGRECVGNEDIFQRDQAVIKGRVYGMQTLVLDLFDLSGESKIELPLEKDQEGQVKEGEYSVDIYRSYTGYHPEFLFTGRDMYGYPIEHECSYGILRNWPIEVKIDKIVGQNYFFKVIVTPKAGPDPYGIKDEEGNKKNWKLKKAQNCKGDLLNKEKAMGDNNERTYSIDNVGFDCWTAALMVKTVKGWEYVRFHDASNKKPKDQGHSWSAKDDWTGDEITLNFPPKFEFAVESQDGRCYMVDEGAGDECDVEKMWVEYSAKGEGVKRVDCSCNGAHSITGSLPNVKDENSFSGQNLRAEWGEWYTSKYEEDPHSIQCSCTAYGVGDQKPITLNFKGLTCADEPGSMHCPGPDVNVYNINGGRVAACDCPGGACPVPCPE